MYKYIYIDGKKTRYAVSKNGTVLSTNYNNTHTWKELKLQTDKDGYKTVHLHINGKTINCRVHRLVAYSFIPLPKRYAKLGLTRNDLEVNHKNGDKSNNHISNLEWCTTKENIIHAELNNLRKHKSGIDHPMVKYTNLQIRQVCYLFEKNELSMKQISDKTGVDIHTVFDIKNNGRWSSISKNYNLDNYNVKGDRRTNCPLRKYDIKLIHKICSMIEKGDKTMKEISYECGVSDGLVQHIKYRSLYSDISKNYNFTKRKGNYNKK